MSKAPLIHRWRMALLGGAIVWGIFKLPQLPNPEAVILAIALVALVALTAWLIGRLRTSR
jgi:hypothetical protein